MEFNRYNIISKLGEGCGQVDGNDPLDALLKFLYARGFGSDVVRVEADVRR